MVSTVARLTYEDLCRAREDGNRYELIEGELVLVASPSPLHQRVSRRLAFAFDRVLSVDASGEVFYAPLDVRFPDGSVVQPDIVVVLSDRASIVGESLIEGVPSLIVEIGSPSSKGRDRGSKRSLYARFGVPEYWYVDLELSQLVIHRHPVEGSYRSVTKAVGAAVPAAIPNVHVSLASLFDRVADGPAAV